MKFSNLSHKDLLNKSGIYKIIINNKFYIGSSSNIYHRLKAHYSYLKRNKHLNPILQNLFNKYGEDNLFVELLEECTKEILIYREKYYIDTLNPYINIIKDPVLIIRDKEFGKRVSEGLKKAYKNKTLIPYQNKKVYQYDSKSGFFIKEFLSMKEAGDIYSHCIRRYIDTSTKVKNFYWRSFKTDKIEIFEKNYIIEDIKSLKKYKFLTMLECLDFLKISSYIFRKRLKKGFCENFKYYKTGPV
jgi:hypothetical protein